MFSFRALEHLDLPLVHRWLNEACVLKWYVKRPFSEGEVAAKYALRIEGREPVSVSIGIVDHNPVGLMQTYRVCGFPDYALSVGADAGWAGVDFLIGEREFRGRGLGYKLLDRLVLEQVFSSLKANTCISGPSPDNLRSVRTLERAGFTYLRTVEVLTSEFEQLMIRRSDNAA